MKTELTDNPIVAAEYIKNGGVVAFPTETVYGLGADIFNRTAIGKVFTAKGRPPDNPLIAHIADYSQINLLAEEIPEMARKLIAVFFPGPLTLVLPKREEISMLASAGLPTIGVRMPSDPTAREFLSACGVPVVAPSANLSGRPSPTSWRAVLEDLDGLIECILRGPDTKIGLESTVVDCTGKRALILRQGAVTLEEIQKILPDAVIADSSQPETARSPGTKYRHYAPHAKVVLTGPGDVIADPGSSAYIGTEVRPEAFRLALVCGSVDEYAARFFEFLRECDRRGIATIYCQKPAQEGIGRALFDRLRRAAGITDG